MVKYLLVTFLFIGFAQASILKEKIESFMGEKKYKTQKNLIDILFKDERKFLKEDASVCDMKVLEKLKQNGILKLFYNEPQELNLSFFTKDNSLIFMRVINESLSSMGYNFFLTKRALQDRNGFLWEIVISTDHIVDPLILADRLAQRGSFIESVEKVEKNSWKYTINTDNIRIDAKKVEADKTIKLKKPIKPYWIEVEDMKSISFVSRLADRWHPNIVFFDEKLRIVKNYEQNRVINKLKLKIPNGVKYIKIADMHTLSNIKRGISIYLKSR